MIRNFAEIFQFSVKNLCCFKLQTIVVRSGFTYVQFNRREAIIADYHRRRRGEDLMVADYLAGQNHPLRPGDGGRREVLSHVKTLMG